MTVDVSVSPIKTETILVRMKLEVIDNWHLPGWCSLLDRWWQVSC